MVPLGSTPNEPWTCKALIHQHVWLELERSAAECSRAHQSGLRMTETELHCHEHDKELVECWMVRPHNGFLLFALACVLQACTHQKCMAVLA